MADSNKEYDARIAALEARAEAAERAAAAVSPITLVPNNAGGIGVGHHAETWSQYDQELANRGEHPLQHKDDEEE